MNRRRNVTPSPDGGPDLVAGACADPGEPDWAPAGVENYSAMWPTRLSRLATWLVNKTAAHSHRLTAEGFAGTGGRRYHYALLASLAEFGASSQASLGRRCGFDRSDVAAMVNELAAAGYVERTQDPADRRRNIIAITDAGQARLAEFDVIAEAMQDRLLAPLSPAERAEFVRLLTRVLNHQAATHGPSGEPITHHT
ncbi:MULTISPECIES: MarR family winged helix-turn-helix transcriptional regulator [unclassified Frankia]|uniref:MarR family winged helix-turn-helix transcriptional regulator n=1 Tax=unclassified Frankia TaxID=2632575 RepID=UPI0027DE62D6|nr:MULTISPECIES: MarR family winged helix-turn-helix transcriptional regulator [unclassified Frankia]